MVILSYSFLFLFVAKAALFGTMRHQLFEETMKEKDFNVPTIHSHVTTIVRKNAEGILSCGASSIEAETEILRFFPQITQFANQFTSFGPSPRNSGAGLENHNRAGHPTCFVAEAVEAVEEPLISPELGLKGNIDMIVRARIGQSSSSHGGTLTTSESMLAVELKTGHNQNTQNAHVAQLALYILMMKSRYGSKTMQSSADLGATESGVLLYMNNGAFKGVHVAPMLSEIKSLIGQRNLLAIEQARATRPRGIILSYERDGDSSIMKARYVVNWMLIEPKDVLVCCSDTVFDIRIVVWIQKVRRLFLSFRMFLRIRFRVRNATPIVNACYI